MKQQQQGGSHSTNIQAAVVHVHGPTEERVREIALDLWRQNMATLTEQARDTAEARAGEIREELVGRLASGAGDPSGFQQPEKQLALLDAQKGYAISGDEELRRSLVEAVLSISGEPERSMKSIVLHEAIKILPSLTRRQVAGITASFITRYVGLNTVNSLNELLAAWSRYFGSSDAPTEGDARHLEYCGCGKYSVFSTTIGGLVIQTYPGLVSLGHDSASVLQLFSPDGPPANALMQCLNDPQKLQIAALNDNVLNSKSEMWTDRQRTAARQLLSQNLIGEEKIKERLESINPTLAGPWGTWVTRFELTSVGLAVGHSYATAIDKNFGSLEVWLQ